MMNQNVMRDPLRAGMEARAHGLPKLLLGVAAVLVLVGALLGPLLRTLAGVFMLRLSAALPLSPGTRPGLGPALPPLARWLPLSPGHLLPPSRCPACPLARRPLALRPPPPIC